MTPNETLVGPGTRVRMHFAITLEDGTPVESTFAGEPLQFTVGDGTIFASVERHLYGLRAGERRRFELGPGEAYGVVDPDNYHTLPRGDFPADMALEPGVVIGFDTPSGEEIAGTVMSVDGDLVTVDFSHPLAGHRLSFEVDLLEVTGPGSAPAAG